MEADWEVEVGGGAPVIDALWPGFVDLRRSPERIGEIAEGQRFPPLASLLLELNGPASPLWTAKCDLWEPDPAELAGTEAAGALSRAALACHPAQACYIDLLPLEQEVYAQWQQAEAVCREWVSRLAPIPLPQCRVDFVVRQAFAGEAQGFGITAYLSAMGQPGDRGRTGSADALAAAMAAFRSAAPVIAAPASPVSKLQ